MGIDIYLKWPRMKEKEKEAQMCGFSIMHGHTGYLREAYHGGPYPSKMLVREAFEAKKCKARISAAVMRERLTSITEPARNVGDEAHLMSMIMQKVADAIQNGAKAGEVLSVDAGEIKSGETAPMTVEEAIRERCRVVYPDMTPVDVENLLNSYRAFVDLAEKMEKKHGKPCMVYASY